MKNPHFYVRDKTLVIVTNATTFSVAVQRKQQHEEHKGNEIKIYIHNTCTAHSYNEVVYKCALIICMFIAGVLSAVDSSVWVELGM